MTYVRMVLSKKLKKDQKGPSPENDRYTRSTRGLKKIPPHTRRMYASRPQNTWLSSEAIRGCHARNTAASSRQDLGRSSRRRRSRQPAFHGDTFPASTAVPSERYGWGGRALRVSPALGLLHNCKSHVQSIGVVETNGRHNPRPKQISFPGFTYSAYAPK